jgi:hypothetical protein
MTFLLDRRRLLIGLAAASTAAAVPVTAGAVQAAAESAELLRLGDMLPAIADEYFDALDAEAQIFRAWNDKLPTPPDAILMGVGRHDELLRDLAGSGLQPTRYVAPSADFTMLAEAAESTIRKGGGPRKAPAALRPILARHREHERLAREYEAERARIVAASGYEAASARRKSALAAFQDTVRRIMAEAPIGMTGVIVQAQAIAAWGNVPVPDQLWAAVETSKSGGASWATTFAATLLRIATA